MKVAALDLGTNTFLCLIADVQEGRIEKVYEDHVQVVRLGQDVQKTKRFQPQALQRAGACLSDFAQVIAAQALPPGHILAVATSAARDVVNKDELFALANYLHIPIEIISGHEEAQITYAGAISGQKDTQANYLVIDVGGGSTEIIFGSGLKVRWSRSFNIGCVRLHEMFLSGQGAASKDSLQSLIQHVQQQLHPLAAELKAFGPVSKALAVAGTPTELARIEIGEFIADKVEGFSLSFNKLQDWQEKFAPLSAEQMTEVYHVSAGRADLLLPGVIILQEFCRVLQLQELIVSTRGVRFGVALEIARRQQ